MSIKVRTARCAYAVTAALLFLGPFATQPASAQPGCRATIDGHDVSEFGSYRKPYSVTLEDMLQLSGTDPAGSHFVRVWVELGSFKVPAETRSVYPPETNWSGPARVADYAQWGVGLYHVVAETQACRLDAWIRVTGSPLSTPAGVAGASAAGIGLAVQALGIARGRRGGGLGLAVVGGFATGPGVLLVAQQAGVVPITNLFLAGSVAVPTVAGGALNTLMYRVGRRAVNRTSVLARHGLGRIGARDVGRATSDATPDVQTPVPAGIDPPAPQASRAEPAAGSTTTRPSASPARRSRGTAATPARRAVARRKPRAARPSAASARGTRRGAAAVAADVDLRDPPRTAYPLLEAEGVVVAGEAFDLTVGLSPAAVADVAGTLVVRPPSSVGPYTLAVHIVADGFSLEGSGLWRRDVRVTADDPYPSFTLRLVADPQQADVVPRTIQAIYSVDGQTIGMGMRAVAVVRTSDLRAGTTPPPAETLATLDIPTAEMAADITVQILVVGSETDGRLAWTFGTPHSGIDIPDAADYTDIGSRPGEFAKSLVEKVAAHEGRAGVFQLLVGIGNLISDQMPSVFWTLLKEVRVRIGGPPTVLILSAEPYVPWELAVVRSRPDDAPPRFLAAQAIVGRWVLAHNRPKLPPPASLTVSKLAVVWSEYPPGWALHAAAEEVRELAEAYGATTIDAMEGTVIECLKGSPEADLLHFALHGIYNPEGAKNGLILVDGNALDPLQVRGTHMRGAPFVFLNACQVGSGERVLGDYAGMANAFLYAGASGVIAPLWSVNDVAAKEIALRFYRKVLEGGALPADVLREERLSFCDGTSTSATALAYLFFGHPRMRFEQPSDKIRLRDAGVTHVT